jgi:hypothetical protein
MSTNNDVESEVVVPAGVDVTSSTAITDPIAFLLYMSAAQ